MTHLHLLLRRPAFVALIVLAALLHEYPGDPVRAPRLMSERWRFCDPGSRRSRTSNGRLAASST